MKKYISTMAVGLALLTLASCSKDTEGLTGITYYPILELEGPLDETILAGSPYVEPGYKATLDGEDYTSEVVVTTNLNFSDPQAGYYTILYTATNPEGFSATAARHIFVVDQNDPINGWYTTNTGSFRDYNGTTTYYGDFPVMVYSNGDGTYHVSDLLGGWYEYRAGYGPSYALGGEISVDADGNIKLLSSYLSGWRDSANSLTDGKFDKEAGTIKYIVDYTEYHMLFNVTLDKN